MKTTSVTAISDEGAKVAAFKHVGGMLRDARNAFKLDLSVIAKEVRIPLSYLEALENGDWSMMPGEVYARGYLKKYAEHLGFDQVKIMSQLQPAAPLADPIRTPVLYPHRRPINMQPFILIGAIVFAGIGLVALLSTPPAPPTERRVAPVPISLTQYLDTAPLTPFYRYSCLQTVSGAALWGCYAELRVSDEVVPIHPMVSYPMMER